MADDGKQQMFWFCVAAHRNETLTTYLPPQAARGMQFVTPVQPPASTPNQHALVPQDQHLQNGSMVKASLFPRQNEALGMIIGGQVRHMMLLSEGLGTKLTIDASASLPSYAGA
jgi:hypothetical protein